MAERRRSAIWSPEALADFDHIWNYYQSAAGKNTAEKVVREIGDLIATIEEHPFAGRSRGELRPGFRSLAARPHVVFYRVVNDIPRSSACWMVGRTSRKFSRTTRTAHRIWGSRCREGARDRRHQDSVSGSRRPSAGAAGGYRAPGGFGAGRLIDPPALVKQRAPAPISASFRSLFEISQIRRRLVLHGGHQEAVGAQDIHLLADGDQPGSFDTSALPPVGMRI
jgi:plasmid stabilization system protein ParE